MELAFRQGEHLLVAGMDFKQDDRFTDVVRPDGERMRVRFRGEAARHPDVEAGLVQLLRRPLDGDIYEAVTSFAGGFGLGATYYLGNEWVIIEIYDPPNLAPLVNASGGSPRSSASRHPLTVATHPGSATHPSRRRGLD
jgi:hypothetical protein